MSDEICNILTYQNQNLSEDCVNSYRNCELLNLFIFLSNIVKTPRNTKMNLNLRFSSIEYNNPSVNEIPTRECNIKILFESLEISTIIKLWSSILSEKHVSIIIYSDYYTRQSKFFNIFYL